MTDPGWTPPAPGAATVSCLTVTQPGRLGRLVESVRCFAHQTHPARELVVVHDGDRRFDADVCAVVAAEAPGLPTSVHKVRRGPLGALRNRSVDVATGEILCQWDDDDLSHPTRIETQVQRLESAGAEACLLTEQLHLFEPDAELRWDDWSVERFPMCFVAGTLLARRSTLPRYPRRRLGEDTPVVTALVAAGHRVTGVQGRGWLHVYVFHDANAWDRDHHRAISAWKHLAERLADDDLEELATELRRYPVDARQVVMPVGTRRVELVIGGGRR